MTDNPYNRTVLYPLEKPLADDLNQEFSQADRSIRDTRFSEFDGANGFLGGSFVVQANSPVAMNVILKAGIGYQDAPTDVPVSIGSVLGLNDLSRYKPIVLANDITIAVPTAPGANSRIDLIEVRYNRQTDNPQSRNFLNTVTNAFAPATVSKTLDFNVDGTLAYYTAAAVPSTALAYKSGVVAASPVAPTVDTGYLALATIVVGTSVTTITSANITLLRAIVGRGRRIGYQTFYVNGTYTPTLGTTTVKIRMVGGGGGGAGVTNNAAQAASGGGGASGVLVEAYVKTNTPITGGAVVIGAAGTAPASEAAGGTGGDTTMVLNTATLIAKGGLGGGSNPSFPFTSSAGGLIQAGSTSASYHAGNNGGGGFGIASGGATVGWGGNGGSSPFGIGGRGGTNGVGGVGTGFGAGGGGGHEALAAVTRAGGVGLAGAIIIEEWT